MYVCVCNLYFYIQYTYISIQYIYLWCNKYVTEPHHTFLYNPFWQTAVVLLHKHFLFTPSPLILPALSQTVSMLLSASVTLPYTRVILKISSVCECSHYSTAVMKEHVRAEFVDSVARHGHFLSHVVTGNEKLVSHETSELKQQSMQWRHISSPTKTKFKQTASTQNIMCTIFWDRRGVLLVDFASRLHNQHSCLLWHTYKIAMLDPE